MSSQMHSLFESCVAIPAGEEFTKSITHIPHCKGVVLLADSSDTPILLLTAADINRVVLNRLSGGDTTIATKRVRLGQITSKIYYTCCWCDFGSSLEYYRLAKQIFPEDYRKIIGLGKVWYVKINFKAKWPGFAVTDNPAGVRQKQIEVFGPFPNRKSTQDYINALNQAFGLCRQQCLIDDPQKAAGCPYYQMHICKAPCMGRISRDEYLAMVRNAVEAIGTDRQKTIELLNNRMRELSEQREFEQAQFAKNQLEQLKDLDKEIYKWVANLRELAILHIDPGPRVRVKGQKKKAQLYRAYFIRSGQISEYKDFNIDAVGEMLKFVETESKKAEWPDDTTITEQLALAAIALYRSKPSGIWLDCRKSPPAEETIRPILQKE